MKQYHPGEASTGEGQLERGDARPDSRGLEDHQHAGGHKTAVCRELSSSVWLEQRIGFQGGEGAAEMKSEREVGSDLTTEVSVPC